MSEKIFLKSFSHFQSLKTLGPRDRASLDHRGMIGRIYVGNLLMVLVY